MYADISVQNIAQFGMSKTLLKIENWAIFECSASSTELISISNTAC